MNTGEIVSAVTNRGYQLTLADGKIRYRGNGGLSNVLMDQLRHHKQAVIVYLAAKEKLVILANEFNWDIDDLLDWYQHDMENLGRLEFNEVRFIVKDYLTNHAANRMSAG